MQLEVVKPVVAEPSSPRMVEPEPVIVAEPEPVIALEPKAIVEPQVVIPPVSEARPESLFAQKAVDPAVSLPAAATTPTSRRRRTTVAPRRIDEPVAARADEAAAGRFDAPAGQRIDESFASRPAEPTPPFEQPAAPRFEHPTTPRVEQPTTPRVEEPVAPRYEQPTAPRFEQPTTPRVEEPVAPRYEQPTAPRFEQPTTPRVEQATTPRVEQPTPPRFEQPTAPRFEQSSAPRVDEFERAARLFSFTAENPTVSTASATPVPPVSTTSTVESASLTAPRTRRARRITAASVSLVAIGAVGLLTVGMTLPTEAVAAATGTPDVTMQLAGHVADGGDGDIQAYVASGAGGGVQGALQRSSGFTTGTEVQLAGTAGITNVSGATFSNNQNCPVQWPFAVGVPISYGFGPRPGEFHEGVDFTPGMGAHIQAIADGVVAVAQDNYQGYGTAVIIDHVVDGQKVASLYGHMELGSLQVHVGQKVKVGEYIGRTGNTGHSYGAHTHVEIRQNDVTPIDPLPWLRAHNQC